MRRLLTLFSLAMALFVTPAYANLLTNGAFDTFSTVNATPDTTSAPGWTTIVNSPDGNDISAKFQSGFANANNTGVGGTQSPGTGAGFWLRAFEGNQGGVGQPLAQASISQSVIAPVSGDYTLNFIAGIEGKSNFTAADFSVSLSSSGTGGSAVLDLLSGPAFASIIDGNIGGAASANPGGTPFSISLSGVTAGDTLTVLGQMVDGVDSGTNPQSGFLDSFALTVPEPTSIALVGMGLVGLLTVRRKR